ncbi:hypothetical protein ABMA28_014633 [Loxostege sticticalis]|uniref:Large ribosomal subunit protein mL62 n=1 Tax=Loxostege sticticalis TaxID=481309 RepID=A0ABD0TDH7_LOXSC
MAFTPLRLVSLQKAVRNVFFTTMAKRPMAYKSAISLETLYPNSSLKLTTPSFSVDAKDKFSGFIPIERLDITYSASSGPGGQNVNKYANKLTKEGYLIIRSDTTRSQQLNLADCMQKLRKMIRDAEVTEKLVSPETEEKIRQRHLKAARLRVAVKREAAIKRAMRQAPTAIDL